MPHWYLTHSTNSPKVQNISQMIIYYGHYLKRSCTNGNSYSAVKFVKKLELNLNAMIRFIA